MDSLAKNFKNEVLVFTTPWNRDGLKFVEKFSEKIDYVSPVWFEVKTKNVGKFDLKIKVQAFIK